MACAATIRTRIDVIALDASERAGALVVGYIAELSAIHSAEGGVAEAVR